MKNVWISLLLLLLPAAVSARSTRETRYRYDQIWNTAVRFVRVDNGFKITEKDAKSGYLMFDYVDGETRQIGALELIETRRGNLTFVTVGLRVQNMPSYIEVLLLDKLERKLRDEYGDPPVVSPATGKDGDSARKTRDADGDDTNDTESPPDERDDS
jgi:hypothetical protein